MSITLLEEFDQVKEELSTVSDNLLIADYAYQKACEDYSAEAEVVSQLEQKLKSHQENLKRLEAVRNEMKKIIESSKEEKTNLEQKLQTIQAQVEKKLSNGNEHNIDKEDKESNKKRVKY